MKQLLILMCLSLVVSTTSCKNDKQISGDIQVVSPEEMETLLELEDVQLVDVRTPEEYKEGYIENSQNIDYKSHTFDEDIEKLDKAKPVVLYCRSGKRSARCAKKLKDAGFIKIYDLEGGISRWQHEGLDVKRNL